MCELKLIFRTPSTFYFDAKPSQLTALLIHSSTVFKGKINMVSLNINDIFIRERSVKTKTVKRRSSINLFKHRLCWCKITQKKSWKCVLNILKKDAGRSSQTEALLITNTSVVRTAFYHGHLYITDSHLLRTVHAIQKRPKFI